MGGDSFCFVMRSRDSKSDECVNKDRHCEI